jgi:hypothetical protein
VRTFLRAELDAANAAWASGDFSPEWRTIRHKAAMGGLIYPPNGTKWDSWEDDSPSQRAMVIRAIRETPALLERCVVGARSWSHVIERLNGVRDEWRSDLDERERDEAYLRRDDPDHREAVTSLAAILERIEGAR